MDLLQDFSRWYMIFFKNWSAALILEIIFCLIYWRIKWVVMYLALALFLATLASHSALTTLFPYFYIFPLLSKTHFLKNAALCTALTLFWALQSDFMILLLASCLTLKGFCIVRELSNDLLLFSLTTLVSVGKIFAVRSEWLMIIQFESI